MRASQMQVKQTEVLNSNRENSSENDAASSRNQQAKS
jgi:hypothetical protein